MTVPDTFCPDNSIKTPIPLLESVLRNKLVQGLWGDFPNFPF